MPKIITIQPEAFVDNVWVNEDGQVVEGKKLPYPFHVKEDGSVDRQDFWRGDPEAVVGFQADVNVQSVDLWWEDAVKDPDAIVGMFPVMIEKGKGFYTYTVAIESVQVFEVPA